MGQLSHYRLKNLRSLAMVGSSSPPPARGSIGSRRGAPLVVLLLGADDLVLAALSVPSAACHSRLRR